MGTTQAAARGISPEGPRRLALGSHDHGGNPHRHKHVGPDRPHPWFALTCLRKAWGTSLAWSVIVASIALTLAGIEITKAALGGIEPAGTQINSVRVEFVDGAMVERVLMVNATVLVSANCTRSSAYTLIRSGGMAQVFPLGLTMSGGGFTTPWKGAYDVVLSLPSGLKPGSYALVVRAVYDCTWLAVLHRRIVVQAPNVAVEIR